MTCLNTIALFIGVVTSTGEHGAIYGCPDEIQPAIETVVQQQPQTGLEAIQFGSTTGVITAADCIKAMAVAKLARKKQLFVPHIPDICLKG